MRRINGNYYLVAYENKDENMGKETSEDGIISFFRKEHFVCTAGYWGCPWYYVDIVSKTFKPGRPGVSYGKVIGNRRISFEEFKSIYERHKNKINVEKITVVLSNGMLARIPAKNWEDTLERLERNIQRTQVVYGTYRLSDGTLVSIPREGAKETLEKMEARISAKK